MLEFVFNQGLNALVQVGQYSDQTYQQYILKALGELAVYVDGMHGLIQCNEIIQWLYELTKSKVGREGGSGREGKDKQSRLTRSVFHKHSASRHTATHT